MQKSAFSIREMIEDLGGPTKAAEVLGGTPQQVVNWRNRGAVPANMVLKVEKVTGISRHVLRPDVFGRAPESAA
jgi:DNA-binding transcriptional regulator YdaS (Cro superfamily)